MQLDRTRLRSPLAGQILKVGVEVGELAGPVTSDPAIIVDDTSRCRVRAFVEEMDARDVRVGMAARITADGPGAGSASERVVGLRVAEFSRARLPHKSPAWTIRTYGRTIRPNDSTLKRARFGSMWMTGPRWSGSASMW